MDEGNTPGLAPPRGKPWDTVMLIDDQIKRRLALQPLTHFQNGRDHVPSSSNMHPFEQSLFRRIFEGMGMPPNLMTSVHQSGKVGQGNLSAPPDAGFSGSLQLSMRNRSDRSINFQQFVLSCAKANFQASQADFSNIP